MNLILKPSKIHGIGVFVVKPIKKGVDPKLFCKKDWAWIKKPTGLERRFCTYGDGGYYKPKDWNRMSIGWYLNHSSNPNIDAKSFKAIKYIKAGDELTIDYNELL